MITMGFGRGYPGGAEHQAELLATELANRGRRVVMYAPSSTCDPAPGLPSRLRVIPVPALGLPRTRTLSYLPMLAAVQAAPGFEHPAILHTHMAWFHAAIPELTRRVRAVRTIVKFACSGADGDIATLTRTAFGRTALRLILGADRLVALTPAICDELLQVGYPAKRIRLIPNGVRVSPPAVPAKDLEILSGPRVLLPGRLTHQKGVLPFLDAWSEVLVDCPSATLLVAGQGDLADAIAHRAAKPDLSGSVHLLGHRSDMPAVLAAADAVVLPSRSEGMSNVALQALAAGRPFFGFAIPGVLEVARHPASLSSPGDYLALARSLARALRQPDLLDEMIQCGFEDVRRDFAIHRVAARYEDLYDELA
jgi:glycosyltransferase involved in cell wall biosynthesis